MLTARLFLAAWDHSLRLNRLGVRSQALWCADFPTHRPTPLPREQPSPGRATLLRHPFGLPTTSLGRRLGGLVPKGLPTSPALHRQILPGRILAGSGIPTPFPPPPPVCPPYTPPLPLPA